MDRRLSTIASQIENGLGLADVGTDHGFLPVHLARHGYTGNLYASDINEGFICYTMVYTSKSSTMP